MFHFPQKSTGTQYTTTVALLILAFIFSPAVLIVSGPLGYMSVSLAVVCSAACIGLACVNWKKYSDLSVPSIATPYARSK
jgi:hypothetical protein